MKVSMILFAAFAALFAFDSVSFAQKTTKTKAKPAAKAKSVKTTPATNPGFIGETEKNLRTNNSTTPPGNGVVFEPNDEPRSNKPNQPGGTAQPGQPGRIMDIVDMVKKDGPEPSRTDGPAATPATPKKPGNRDQNLTGGTVIVSSKTTKPKATPAKTKVKRKP